MNSSQAKQLFVSLCDRLNEPQFGVATNQEVLAGIRDELLQNRLFLADQRVQERRMIMAVVDGTALRWDVPDSPCVVRSIKSVLERVVPSSVESLLSLLDEILRDLLVFKSSVRCPQCGDDDLRCFYSCDHSVVVLNCDVCDWSEAEEGQSYKQDWDLIPAPTGVLQKRNLLH